MLAANQRLRATARKLARGNLYGYDLFGLIRDVLLLGNCGPAPKNRDAQLEYGICAQQEAMLAEKLLRMVMVGDGSALRRVAATVDRFTEFLSESEQDHTELALVAFACRHDTSEMTVPDLHADFHAETRLCVELRTFYRWIDKLKIPHRPDQRGPKRLRLLAASTRSA